jgi:PAS domain-containing protein
MASVQAEGRGTGSPVEVRIHHADGGWRLMEVVGRTIRNGQGTFVVCTARDLTDRRMWELSGSDDAKLAAVLQHAPAITMLLDDDLRVVGVNGAFTRLLGWDPSTWSASRCAVGRSRPRSPASPLRSPMRCRSGPPPPR